MTHDPLEARGMGIIYRDFLKTDDGKFDVEDYPSLRNRILRLYAEHQIELARLLVKHPGLSTKMMTSRFATIFCTHFS